jgi:hypothetical protein
MVMIINVSIEPFSFLIMNQEVPFSPFPKINFYKYIFILYIEKPLFNRVENIRVWDIEFSYKVQEFFNAWNISVHTWLKHYVFLRMVIRGQKVSLFPILTTFAVSAVWHGFYPGYFLFFISSGLNDYLFKSA